MKCVPTAVWLKKKGRRNWLCFRKARWWIQIFFFSPLPGETIQLDQCFSNGLKPPTRRFFQADFFLFVLRFYGSQHKGSSFSKVARGDVALLEKLIWDQMNESRSLTLQKRIMISLVFQNYQNTLGSEMFRTPFQAEPQDVWKGIQTPILTFGMTGRLG